MAKKREAGFRSESRLVRQKRLAPARYNWALRFENHFEPAVDPIWPYISAGTSREGCGHETGRHDGILPVHDQHVVRIVEIVFGDMAVRFSFGAHRFDASHCEARLFDGIKRYRIYVCYSLLV